MLECTIIINLNQANRNPQTWPRQPARTKTSCSSLSIIHLKKMLSSHLPLSTPYIHHPHDLLNCRPGQDVQDWTLRTANLSGITWDNIPVPIYPLAPCPQKDQGQKWKLTPPKSILILTTETINHIWSIINIASSHMLTLLRSASVSLAWMSSCSQLWHQPYSYWVLMSWRSLYRASQLLNNFNNMRKVFHRLEVIPLKRQVVWEGE